MYIHWILLEIFILLNVFLLMLVTAFFWHEFTRHLGISVAYVVAEFYRAKKQYLIELSNMKVEDPEDGGLKSRVH